MTALASFDAISADSTEFTETSWIRRPSVATELLPPPSPPPRSPFSPQHHQGQHNQIHFMSY